MASAVPRTGLSYWRNRLFTTTITYFFPLSFIAVIPGIAMSLLTGLYLLAFVDFFAFLICAVITFKSGIDINIRKAVFTGLIYVVAIALLYYLGSFGPGLLYLLGITFFTVLIFPGKVSYWPVVLNTLVCVVFAFLIYFDMVGAQAGHLYTVGSWVAVSSNLIVLSAVMAKLLPVLFLRLQRSNERYEIVAKATSDTVWDYDMASGKVTYNDGIRTTFGYAECEIPNLEQWLTDKIHPADKVRVDEAFGAAIGAGATNFQIEYRFLCADNTYKYILDRSFVLRDSSGKPIRITGAMQDISELKVHVNAIRAQNMKLREIAWTQSHVVRAPLARLLGLVDILASGKYEQSELPEILNYITSSANELDGIVKDIVKKTEEI